MNKRTKIHKFWLILAGLIALLTFEVNAQSSTILTFYVNHLNDDSGQVVVYLFRKEDKIPSSPFRKVKAKINHKTAVITIDDLPYGDYAAIINHDKNLNEKVDHRWGMPSEPLTYTNHWKFGVFSGMPSFQKLKFIFSEKNTQYHINM